MEFGGPVERQGQILSIECVEGTRLMARLERAVGAGKSARSLRSSHKAEQVTNSYGPGDY